MPLIDFRRYLVRQLGSEGDEQRDRRKCENGDMLRFVACSPGLKETPDTVGDLAVRNIDEAGSRIGKLVYIDLRWSELVGYRGAVASMIWVKGTWATCPPIRDFNTSTDVFLSGPRAVTYRMRRSCRVLYSSSARRLYVSG